MSHPSDPRETTAQQETENALTLVESGSVDRTIKEQDGADRTSDENADRTNENLSLPPSLEVHAQLEWAYRFLNEELFFKAFGVRLPPVMFTLPRSRRFVGYFKDKAWEQEP